MNKKAQAQIITTILIILLVLAAIVIIWQVISSTIEKGGKEIESQSGCIGVTMDVTKADAGESVISVRRGQGSTSTVVSGYKVFINGAQEGVDENIDLGPLSTDFFQTTSPLVSGQEISLAAIVDTTTVCAASSIFIVE